VFVGVGVALVTLFDRYLAVDPARSAGLAAQLVQQGVAAVVVAGTTGEAAALDGPERAALVAAVKSVLPQGVPVICGVGAPSTYQALRYLDHALDAGADGLLALSLPGAADQLAYYEALAAHAGSTPLLAYHYPKASAPGLPVEVLASLPVSGVKDSSGDTARLRDTKASFAEPIYTGSPSLLSTAAGLGCAGVIIGLANALPAACVAAFTGDDAAQARLAPAIQREKGSFPAAIKEMTAESFGTPTHRRMG